MRWVRSKHSLLQEISYRGSTPCSVPTHTKTTVNYDTCGRNQAQLGLYAVLFLYLTCSCELMKFSILWTHSVWVSTTLPSDLLFAACIDKFWKGSALLLALMHIRKHNRGGETRKVSRMWMCGLFRLNGVWFYAMLSFRCYDSSDRV